DDLAAVTLLSILPLLFTHTATPDIYTLSLHDALPISEALANLGRVAKAYNASMSVAGGGAPLWTDLPLGPGSDYTTSMYARLRRSEEHTSELQSHLNLVCRLLLEKKKTATLLTHPTLQ